MSFKGHDITQDDTPTNISHLVFGITSSSRTWKNRISYVESWWKPNITRGFVFLESFPKDHQLLPWPYSSCPPFKVSEDTSRYKMYDKHPIQQTIRMARVVEETFKMENKSARCYALVEAMVENLDICIKKYQTYYGGDHILQSCVADLGVSLTQEKGFHQIDLHGDISGFLSAHPQSPLISLHHLDYEGSRRECCDVVYKAEMNVTEIKLRDCMLDEIIP
ncbi:hypothetical protein KY290_027230 [Solanum tuberosum]|uniref:Uncharacterized protein n=1 Tax=Solanum tuberosum TaxID=4113 RepID=A0ABQ7UG69_SOLTU|nr:hypothetical protein KY290_027230 [Solanum tuberosum]